MSSDIIVHTDAGRAVFCAQKLAVLTSPKFGTHGSIALGVLLDSQDKPSCYCLFWEWGGDWNVFVDGDENNAEALQGWEPDAVNEAVSEAVRICPSCEEDMEWFSDWAARAEETLDSRD